MAFELLLIVKHKQPSLSKYPVGGGLRVLGVIFSHPRLKRLGEASRDCIAWGIGNRQSMDSYLCRITDHVSMVEKPSQETGPPESA